MGLLVVEVVDTRPSVSRPYSTAPPPGLPAAGGDAFITEPDQHPTGNNLETLFPFPFSISQSGKVRDRLPTSVSGVCVPIFSTIDRRLRSGWKMSTLD